LALGPGIAHAQQQTFEVTAAQGLAGVTNVNPGGEVKIYHAHLRDFFDNNRKSKLGPTPGANGIDVTVSDLSAPTGLVAGDFTELRLYRSNDANFDAGDTFMTSTTPVGIGAATLLDISGVAPATLKDIPEIDDGPNEVYFIITAVIAGGATPGHAFRLGTAGANVDVTDTGGGAPTDYQVGSAIVAADANRVVIVAAGGGGGGGGGGGVSGSAPVTSISAMPPMGYGLLAALLMGYGVYALNRRDR
jgi:hypothetical protein